MFVEKTMQWKFQLDGCLTVRNGGKLYWKPKSTTDCSAREEEEEFKYNNEFCSEKTFLL
jgi:hypothetical protein